MFLLTDQPIDPRNLRSELEHASAGAFVSFEGRVRNQNNDREVQALEYEATEQLAQNQFAEIASEVREKFDVLDFKCIHRTGRLDIGELAVWIGVISMHRKAAFNACEYIIDELKQRLPIWKKESYAAGESEWINHA